MMKKRFAIMTLCFTLILLTCTPVVYAAKETATVRETTTVIYLDNGFYLVTTLRTYVSPAAPAGAVAQVSGSKTADLYSASYDKLCSLTVDGIFSFDGRNAKALSANYSYAIYNVLWGFSDGSSCCEDNTAYATATFNRIGILPTNLSVSLSCSPEGVLS